MTTQTTAATADLNEIDLADPELWQPEPPYELFARLRREAPVHWSPYRGNPEGRGFWSITRAADVHEISRDWETFSSEKGGIFLLDDTGVPLAVQQQQMISMDPPRHDKLKAIVQRAFTPRRIAEHADQIRAIVDATFDRVAERGECDLVADVARPIPARVIGSMLGTPPEDDPMLVRWTNVATAFEDSEIRATWDDTVSVVQNEVMPYVTGLKQARLEQPTDDLFSALIEAEVAGERLDDVELMVFFVLIMAAGNDSTRATYSATMHALMSDPEQRALLAADPEGRIEDVVEEGLRCFPAFAYMARTATRDVDLHGATIRAGDKLALWYVSSNRDPERFPEQPDRFDITRSDEDHQAFGAGGRHFCLGSALARLELRIWIAETLRRFPDMQLAGAPQRMQSLFLNQYTSIPVRWSA